MFSFIRSAASAVANQVQQQVQTHLTQTQPPIQIGERWVNIKEQLGEGGFAYVYSCEDSSTGQPFALKKMLCQDSESRTIAEKEIRMLKLLKNHPHIIQFAGSCMKENTQSSHKAMEYYILMELCTGGSLIDLIKRRDGQKLGEISICELFMQICRGVAHMHGQSPPIAHRDLKIENVLINSRGELKLCDFGSCCTESKAYTTQKEIVEEEERISKYSTQMYRSPELVEITLQSAIGKRTIVNEKVDIWALGCILYTLAFFTQPFQDGGNLQIISGSYQLPDSHPFSKYLTALIKRLLTVDPAKRPDIQQVINLCEQWHTWLKGGGKQLKAKSVSSASDTAASSSSTMTRQPPPATAITDPTQRRKHDGPTESPKPPKVKKSHRSHQPPPSAPPETDNWADFSSAPIHHQSTPPIQLPSQTNSSEDSSSDESTNEKKGRATNRPPINNSRQNSTTGSTGPSSSTTTSTSQSTASLFDLSAFGDFVGSPSPSSKPSTASTTVSAAVPASSHAQWQVTFDPPTSHDDEWASFDSHTPTSTLTKTTTTRTTPTINKTPEPSPPTTNSFEFDFSGLTTATQPTNTATRPTTISTSHTSPAAHSHRKQRHHDHKSETIDLSRLTVGRQNSRSITRTSGESDNEEEGEEATKSQRIGKITIGKSKS